MSVHKGIFFFFLLPVTARLHQIEDIRASHATSEKIKNEKEIYVVVKKRSEKYVQMVYLK